MADRAFHLARDLHRFSERSPQRPFGLATRTDGFSAIPVEMIHKYVRVYLTKNDIRHPEIHA